jgi:preprotein translocase subunit SecG
MYQLLMIVHICIAIFLIGLVLIQHGKGADVGAGLGTGASGTVFGSQGTGRFLFKLTGGLALGFFVTSLLLSALVTKQYHARNQLSVPAEVESTLPMPVETDVKK